MVVTHEGTGDVMAVNKRFAGDSSARSSLMFVSAVRRRLVGSHESDQ